MRLTHSAEQDLAELWAYIAAQASEIVATSFLVQLQAQYENLVRFPESGAPRDQLVPGLRVQLFRGYASYYRVEERYVIIVRVLSGRQDITALAGAAGFEG